jgi:hypothetical protein
MTRLRNSYLNPEVDDGLPNDWGEPEELPTVNDYLGPAPWAFGNWRFVVVELTADERVALTKLANEQCRDTDAMAALLIRQGLKEKAPELGSGPMREPDVDALCKRLRRSHATPDR